MLSSECDLQWMWQWKKAPDRHKKIIISDVQASGNLSGKHRAKFPSECSTVPIDLSAVIMVYPWSTRHH